MAMIDTFTVRNYKNLGHNFGTQFIKNRKNIGTEYSEIYAVPYKQALNFGMETLVKIS